jgi:uncharacterized protein (DUF1330 family)
MNTTYKMGLAMIAGLSLGAAAVQGLHAQAKPPVYFVAEVDVMDPEAYGKEYAPKAQALIKSHGGKFLAIGGTAGANAKQITGFDGQAPKRAVVQVWDSMEKLQAWARHNNAAPLSRSREAVPHWRPLLSLRNPAARRRGDRPFISGHRSAPSTYESTP